VDTQTDGSRDDGGHHAPARHLLAGAPQPARVDRSRPAQGNPDKAVGIRRATTNDHSKIRSHTTWQPRLPIMLSPPFTQKVWFWFTRGHRAILGWTATSSAACTSRSVTLPTHRSGRKLAARALASYSQGDQAVRSFRYRNFGRFASFRPFVSSMPQIRVSIFEEFLRFPSLSLPDSTRFPNLNSRLRDFRNSSMTNLQPYSD
jgi:hypothetical protein